MEKQPSILIIEDDKDNQELISKILKKSFSKIKIHIASNGKDGIKIAKNHDIDTIFLDLLMPNINGYTVCKKLKRNKSTRNIPIIIITGVDVSMDTKVKTFEIGADAFLSKPLRKAELVAQLKVMLRIKYAEDKIREEKNILENLVNKRTEEFRLLVAHTLSLQEEERGRISKCIHDELGQMLVGLQFGHESLLKLLKHKDINPQKEKLLSKVKDLVSLTSGSFDSIRKIIHDIHPPVLDHLGLFPAIKWIVKDFHNKTEIELSYNNTVEKDIVFSNEQNTAIFRIFQEALTNIAKHSKAGKVVINIETVNNSKLKFSIKDDGCGFDTAGIDRKKSFGILGMRERARQYKWELTITGTSTGTELVLITPLKE